MDDREPRTAPAPTSRPDASHPGYVPADFDAAMQGSSAWARATASVEGAAQGVAGSIDEHQLAQTAGAIAAETEMLLDVARTSGRQRSHHVASENIQHIGSDRIQRRAQRPTRLRNLTQRALHRTRDQAEAIAASARRARLAPAAVGASLGAAAKAWTRAAATVVGLYAAAAILAVAVAGLLVAGVVLALMLMMPALAAVVTAAAACVVAALLCIVAARGRLALAGAESAGHLRDAATEVRDILAPLRDQRSAVRSNPPNARDPAPHLSSQFHNQR